MAGTFLPGKGFPVPGTVGSPPHARKQIRLDPNRQSGGLVSTDDFVFTAMARFALGENRWLMVGAW
jgi:hypothetical protein